jgi:threonine/homoserine/homoserine lactone efflux protein
MPSTSTLPAFAAAVTVQLLNPEVAVFYIATGAFAALSPAQRTR